MVFKDNCAQIFRLRLQNHSNDGQNGDSKVRRPTTDGIRQCTLDEAGNALPDIEGGRVHQHRGVGEGEVIVVRG